MQKMDDHVPRQQQYVGYVPVISFSSSCCRGRDVIIHLFCIVAALLILLVAWIAVRERKDS